MYAATQSLLLFTALCSTSRQSPTLQSYTHTHTHTHTHLHTHARPIQTAFVSTPYPLPHLPASRPCNQAYPSTLKPLPQPSNTILNLQPSFPTLSPTYQPPPLAQPSQPLLKRQSRAIRMQHRHGKKGGREGGGGGRGALTSLQEAVNVLVSPQRL